VKKTVSDENCDKNRKWQKLWKSVSDKNCEKTVSDKNCDKNYKWQKL
jgi:hypothetical protein